jgi:hypothetical protein
MMGESLPPHLGPLNWEPLAEPEAVALQVALLTMELATLRPRLGAIERDLDRLVTALRAGLPSV